MTPRGHALVEQIREGKREWFRNWVAELADDDLAALLRGLQAIVAVASRRRNGVRAS